MPNSKKVGVVELPRKLTTMEKSDLDDLLQWLYVENNIDRFRSYVMQPHNVIDEALHHYTLDDEQEVLDSLEDEVNADSSPISVTATVVPDPEPPPKLEADFDEVIGKFGEAGRKWAKGE